MKTIIPILAAVAACLLSSCATSPRAPVVTAPLRVENVQPVAAKVRESIREADKMVSVIQREATQAAGEATAARVEAERLKEKQTATAGELDALWQSLKSVEARNLFLEKESKTLAYKLTAMTGEAANFDRIASAKDAEATTLRGQNGDMARTIAEIQKALDSQTAKLAKAEKKGAAAGVYRIWVIVGAVTITILLAGIVYLKLFAPRIPRIPLIT